MPMPNRLRLDVLDSPPVRPVVRSGAFPLAFQALALAALAALAVNGWGLGAEASVAELKTLRKTNLTTLAVWGLWWPGMIVGALLLGRAWCAVCPLELLERVGNTLARRVGLRQRVPGRALASGWFVVVAYVALQLAVATAAIHRVPHFTALLLVTLAGTALATGVVFRPSRTFCRSLCPASALLSTYGRTSPVGLDVRDPDACARCVTRDCVRAENRDRLDGRSCPSNLRPWAREGGDGCQTCLQCTKACPERNLGAGLVAPDAPQRRYAALTGPEALFVAIVSGFVTYEITGESPAAAKLFRAVPDALAGALGLPGELTGALWFLVLFPLLAWTLIIAVASAFGARGKLAPLAVAAATAAAPVVAAAHLAKALAKLSTWAPHLPAALRDPAGLDTARAIRTGAITAPPALATLDVVAALAALVLVALAVRSWRHAAAGPAAARVSIPLLAGLFSFVLASWAAGR